MTGTARKTAWFSAPLLLLVPLLLGNKSCLPDVHSPDSSVTDAGGVTDDCSLAECGPAPGMPNYVCDDGTVAGPGGCERLANGNCGYPIVTCPDATDAGGLSLACGTRGGAQCGAGEFCDYAAGAQCGALDQGGTCRARPEVCDTVYAPVCGCDLRTRSNLCEANAKGSSVLHDGACTVDECQSAGGIAVYSDGASIPDCQPGQEKWSLSGGKEAVVCCLDLNGSGGAVGRTCGGIAGLSCDAGQFCNFEPDVGGMGCDGSIADGTGVCQAQPSACTREYKPVCGCDRKTHSTACEAHSLGVSVLHDGLCTDRDCQAIGGHAVDGLGPPPACSKGEMDYGAIVYESGVIPTEGTLCCVP